MAEKKSTKGKSGPAIGKRARIDKAQRNMLIVVGVASVVLGITLVLVVYFAKTMAFNSKLIGVNDEVITVYKNTQKSLETVSREITELSKNEYFESVARQRSEDCAVFDETDEEGGAITEFSLEEIETARECSALRVITDALPSVMNKETALTSFIILLELPKDGSSVESASGGDLGVKTIEGVTMNTIDMSVSFDDYEEYKIMNSLASIEKSIRNFDISSVSITFSTSGLELSTKYKTYYSGESSLRNIKRTVCADKENEACVKAGGDNTIVDVAN